MSKVVVLGTAHLASTPGKCSPDKCFREYKYSREICVELQKRLRACGVECYIDYLDDDMPGKNSSQELIERELILLIKHTVISLVKTMSYMSQFT